jgi:hypothetical protein
VYVGHSNYSAKLIDHALFAHSKWRAVLYAAIYS